MPRINCYLATAFLAFACLLTSGANASPQPGTRANVEPAELTTTGSEPVVAGKCPGAFSKVKVAKISDVVSPTDRYATSHASGRKDVEFVGHQFGGVMEFTRKEFDSLHLTVGSYFCLQDDSPD
jgi:hypothetical protein